jgi:aryl-alcohol dehydrogenase-like predicted oxidoreductase
VLDAAWAAGVRYFDAARSYGRAERFLASWLTAREIAPEEVAVGSKWGYRYTAGWEVRAEVHEVKEHTLERLALQFRESRELLGAHLDLYQVHSATISSGVLDDEQVTGQLWRIREMGPRIGLSLTGPAQAGTLRRAMAVERDGVRLFDAVQATWNLLERSAGEALAEAHAAGMGVVVKEALANGRLTERNDAAAFAPKLEALRAEAERLGTTVDALTLAAVLARPWADVVLSGAAVPGHLRSNLRALETTWDDEAEERLAHLVEEPERYWETRAELPWN